MATRLAAYINPGRDRGADGYHPSDFGDPHWAELMWRGVRAPIAPH
jgi:hypothetical protein